jgi:hypothetical protein
LRVCPVGLRCRAPYKYKLILSRDSGVKCNT